MEDLPQFALKLFEIEKKLLLEEKQEYSCSVAIVITPEGRHYWEEVVFNDETEMDAAYEAIVVRAKSKRATAIITISTVRTKDVADESELESYWWGKLASENQPRCLFLTISGPNLKSVSISLPFSVENNQVVLGTQTDFEPTIVNMLPNWP